MKRLLFFTLVVLTMAAGLRHEFHVSITDVHDEGDTVKVAVKLFVHDLEEQIKQQHGSAVFLDHSTPPEKQLRHIRDYVSPRFSISTAAKAMRIEWIGHELEDDVCWVYGYCTPPKDIKLLFVKNTLMFEHDEDQHNMIHYHRGDKISSKVCSPRNSEVQFSRS